MLTGTELQDPYNRDADVLEYPWSRWEVKTDTGWVKLRGHPTWSINNEYRRATDDTVLVNGVRVAAPLTTTPRLGTVVYYPTPTHESGAANTRWCSSSEWQRGLLEKGILYINHNDAVNRFKAMLLTK